MDSPMTKFYVDNWITALCGSVVRRVAYLVRTSESLYSVQSMANIRIRLIFDSSNTLVNRLGPSFLCHQSSRANHRFPKIVYELIARWQRRCLSPPSDQNMHHPQLFSTPWKLRSVANTYVYMPRKEKRKRRIETAAHNCVEIDALFT